MPIWRRDIGDLIQYLHADRASGADQLLGSVALAGSPDAIYSNTFESRKLPGIRLVPVELEISGKPAAKHPKAL